MATNDPSDTASQRSYGITYRVEPPIHCPMRDVGESVVEISTTRTESELTCEFVLREDDDTRWISQHNRLSECPCAAPFDHEAVPHAKPVGTDLLISVYLDVPETAFDIAEAMEDRGSDVAFVDSQSLDEEPPALWRETGN